MEIGIQTVGYWWPVAGCDGQNRESGVSPEQIRYCDRERKPRLTIVRILWARRCALVGVAFTIEKLRVRKSGDRPGKPPFESQCLRELGTVAASKTNYLLNNSVEYGNGDYRYPLKSWLHPALQDSC